MGGLDLLINTDFSSNYEWSRAIYGPLENSDPERAETEQTLINRNIKTERQNITLSKKACIMENFLSKKTNNNPSITKRSIELAKRASLKKFNFSLNKSELEDGLHLRYGWQPPNTPHTCPCEPPFTLTHSLHSPKGEYTHLIHNEILDTFAALLDEVCHDVEIGRNFNRWKAKPFTTNNHY